MENDFFKYLEAKFTLLKLRDDIEKYINYNVGNLSYMPAAHEFDAEEKLIEYKREDLITLIAVRVNKGYNGILFIPYIVEVAIGDFEKDTNINIWEVSKCKAEILYNEDLEMFSIDFIYW